MHSYAVVPLSAIWRLIKTQGNKYRGKMSL